MDNELGGQADIEVAARDGGGIEIVQILRGLIILSKVSTVTRVVGFKTTIVSI